MTSEARNRKRANNDRAPLADIRHFLCYMCGDLMSSSVEYQKHMSVHQAMAVTYQCWHAKYYEKSRRRSKGISTEQSSDTQEKVLSNTKNNSKDAPDRSQPARKASDVDLNEPRVGSRKRKTPPDAEDPPEKKTQQSPSAKIVKEKKKKNETIKKVEKRQIEKPTSSFSSQEQRKPSFLKHESERRCGSCDYSCHAFDEYICHYIDAHGAVISKVMLNLFKNDQMFRRKQSPPGGWCARCNLKFMEPEEYYKHLVSEHVKEVAALQKLKAEELTSVDTDVHLNIFGKPEVIFSFNLEIPAGKTAEDEAIDE